MGELKTVSLVVSVYNEEANVREFYRQARAASEKAAGYAFEYVFVDDGSRDGSLAELISLSESEENVRVIKLSRNFGHEAAMLAGIDGTKGDAVICMDSDLQHPPEMIPEMLAKYSEGCDIVNMARAGGGKTRIVKRLTSFLFYKFLNLITSIKLEENASDFFLVSNRAADVLRSEYREQSRFLRGFVQIMGFPKAVLQYESRERFSGESKYGFRKLFALSVNALASFSNVPLRIGIFAGCATGLLSVGVAVYSMIIKWLRGAPPGYTTIVIMLCVLFSVNFFVLGIIGEYIGHVLYESKKRPLYIVDGEYGRGACEKKTDPGI
ncbi:MAG: glycosyltransferase family 2 protein [Defluviitaleaceae bacterium]|nr:glycosyltransferase family 2 protein [Defluviitaleaceae bacterium]